MHQISFGNVLKEARLAKGWDLASVSRELRIRQDIIVAIENSDFRRMPSRGYARNMIIAYSRLLGLNAQDVSRMYLDQEYAFQVEQAHQNVSEAIRMHDPSRESRSSRSSTSSFDRVRSSGSRTRSSGAFDDRNQYDGSSNGYGRAVYSQNPDVYPTLQGGHPSTHKARRSAMGEGKYGNMYSAPRNIPNPHRYRNIAIVAIAVVVVVVALVLALTMSHHTQTQANIPVTGAQSVGTTTDEAASKQQDSAQQQSAVVETAPTEFTLKYTVDKGSQSYIEVYVDDVVQESATVTGAAEKSYTSSTKIRFVATETTGVTVYINDEAQQLETNSSGIVNTTYNFSDILEQWYTAHPNVKRDSSATASGSSSSTSTSSTSTGSSAGSASKTQQ